MSKVGIASGVGGPISVLSSATPLPGASISTHPNAPPPDPPTLAAFGLDAGAIPTPLPGGEGRTFLVDNTVLKLVHGERDVAAWAADLHANIRANGFRLSRPLRTVDGGWLTHDGWSAWTLLQGHHDVRGRFPECIAAITRYHEALRRYPYPTILDTIDNPWRRADRHAFGPRPATTHPALADQIDALYEMRRPITGLTNQLIHGDLNPGNLLLALEPPPNGRPPGIIDIAPYWRPAGFALAVFAYWIGPWYGTADPLAHFQHVDQLDQLLIRAALRMLLTSSQFAPDSGAIQDLERYTRATEIILHTVR
ncbi:MAG: phosphotransferase [Chloroflexota bacterium]